MALAWRCTYEMPWVPHNTPSSRAPLIPVYPLSGTIRSWPVPPARDCCLLLPYKDPRKQDDLMALVVSVVYRQHAIPVAWHNVGAQERGSWIDPFCLLLRLLAPAVPATVPVHVLCDQGLGSRDLWAQIVGSRLASLPALPAPHHLSARGPDPTCTGAHADRGTGRPVGGHRAGLPRRKPLVGTLMVLHAYGQAQPWVLLTDTPGGADGAHPVCLPQLD